MYTFIDLHGEFADLGIFLVFSYESPRLNRLPAEPSVLRREWGMKWEASLLNLIENRPLVDRGTRGLPKKHPLSPAEHLILGPVAPTRGPRERQGRKKTAADKPPHA